VTNDGLGLVPGAVFMSTWDRGSRRRPSNNYDRSETATVLMSAIGTKRTLDLRWGAIS